MAPRPITEAERQRRMAKLAETGGNITQAAEELGIARQTLQYTIKNDFKVFSTSTLYDADGEVRLTWVKEKEDAARQDAMMRETIASFVAEITPAKPTPQPPTSNANLCAAYVIGDAHMGMYAWGEEAGDDYDTDIAKSDIMGAAQRLLGSTPACDEAIVVQLGDFYHADDGTAQTPKHHHKLDVDTRFAKVIRTGIATMRFVIDSALSKHRLVRVRNVAGNHDPHASITLTEALRGYYVNEPRVIIEDNPRAFFVFRFGSNLVGITHGHTIKPERMAGVLAVDGMAHWSDTDFKYVWHGHRHQRAVFESMGVLVESFRTLAAKDAFAAENGYRPGREMQAVVLHREFGEIERHTAGIKRVRGNGQEARSS
jgi:transposase-like protein/predicted phosphodiesterase